MWEWAVITRRMLEKALPSACQVPAQGQNPSLTTQQWTKKPLWLSCLFNTCCYFLRASCLPLWPDKWTHRTTNPRAFMSGSNRIWLKGSDWITFVCNTACPPLCVSLSNGTEAVKNAGFWVQMAPCHRSSARQKDLYPGAAECFSVG